MQATTARNTHPLVIVAAIAVTAFSLVGIGAVLGWIPTSTGSGNVAPALPVAQAPEQPLAVPQPAVEPAAQEPAQPAPKAEAPRPAKKAVAKRPKQHDEPVVARAEPQPAAPEYAPPAPVIAAVPCRDCAVIEDVREVEKEGKASGGGAITGAILGGILGHQVGNGRGKDVATVLGAIGGGFGGHQVEKNINKAHEYQITVRYEDGTSGLFTQAAAPAWRIGDKVKIVDGAIQARG